jgi:hypothetical protein
MDINQEKVLLLNGIAHLKYELMLTRGPRSIDILERLETLRNCLEILISKELRIFSKEI